MEEHRHRARICIPICESRASELAREVARATAEADLIELRMDCLSGVELALGMRYLDDFPGGATERPLILTLRPAEQGGAREIDILNRLSFWVERFLYDDRYEGFADIELELLQLIRQSEDTRWRQLDWTRVICSHHDFTGVPATLAEIYERMASTPARILKLAVRARDATDCIPVFQLLERARQEGREMIAIAMGEAGFATRILGPSRGSFLTYASLGPAQATAPGQITARALRDLYRVREIDRRTQIMGLMGQPVTHSVSPQIHNAAFAALGMNAVYLPLEVRDARAFLRRMVHPAMRELDWNLRGLSVTAPHKSAVLEALDEVDPCARETGAVNTIVVGDERLAGYNTDAAAFLEPLRSRLGPLGGARCALIGSGGAARSALWALQKEGAQVTVFARDAEKAGALAGRFGASFAPLEGALFDGFDLVVNSTPLGTLGPNEGETPAMAHQLRGARLAYDLVYNPPMTRFMREAEEAGCAGLGGLAMLVAQAAEQFRLWSGRDAPLDLMREAAERALFPPPLQDSP
ncbi:MAG TPA: shikimate dehydrogenase [Pyrinomonadaceae bacterium]|jgi:3-dehydroquinate dehydratase/shikimate dehydrogenase